MMTGEEGERKVPERKESVRFGIPRHTTWREVSENAKKYQRKR
jgi:hypothetical protein